MRILKKIYSLYMGYSNPIKYARTLGVSIGDKCKLNGSPNWGSEPWLISIGNHTEVSFDVSFITHDGSTWVFRNQEKYRGVVRFGRIEVGNNCFIGARSTILPCVRIGDNSIIAAGSVCTKSVPDGEVWGGIPAKFLMKVDNFAEKCLEETPEFNSEQMRTHKKEETLRITAGKFKL